MLNVAPWLRVDIHQGKLSGVRFIPWFLKKKAGSACEKDL
jgi:hypothetical protein